VNAAGFESGHGEKIAEKYSVLVDGAGARSGHTPVRQKPLVVPRLALVSARMRIRRAGKDAEHRVGVAYIEDEQHVGCELLALSSYLLAFSS
jgi:hypothetical protein